jgi:hypothetical protein
LPGSPYSPWHPTWRAIYAVVAFVTATAATLGNALITRERAEPRRSLGEYVAAVRVLPAIYVAMNASGNLAIVKARIQWGIPVVTQGLLGVYATAALLQLIFPPSRSRWSRERPMD